jgi:hypothetical protein
MRGGRPCAAPAALLGLVALFGCYGGRQDGGDAQDGGEPERVTADGADDDDGGDDDGGVASQCGEPSPGASPIRRLTAWEYDNTILDLLGDDSHPSQSFPEEGGSGFDNNADVASVTWLMANKYMLAAEEISARAIADLGTLLPCDPAAGDETACVSEWIATFGPRAWRRPLTAEESAAMLQLYADARESDDVPTSVGLVLQAFLQSPHFLYRVELGIPGEEGAPAVALDDFELASRLSYFLWGSMPDDTLFAAAAAGELSTHEDVEAQARRMLDDPKARRMVSHFYEQWLGYMKLDVIDKDPELFPAYTPEIAAKQRAEAEAFTDHVMFEADATLTTLFTAPYTFVDAELAAFYGIDAPAGSGDGSELVKVEIPGQDVAGVLSLGGILASYSKPNMTNPIARGIFVREHLLCTIPPPPPDNADIVPPQPDPDATVREQFEQHRSDPSCSACHMLFDPIGFGFENYDAVGRWRELENGQNVDASGELLGTDVDGPFVGPAELGAMLAQSEDVAQCVARQWFRFAYGRTESAELDECNLDTIDEAFAESGNDLRELLVSLTQTDAFMLRTAYAAEGGA